MRLVFFGSGAFGVPTLEALAVAHDVVLVVTQPDRPAGRSRQPTPTPIASVAMAGLRATKISTGVDCIAAAYVRDVSCVRDVTCVRNVGRPADRHKAPMRPDIETLTTWMR